MRLFLFCFLLSIGFQNVIAQTSIDEKINWYGKSKAGNNFFVHFDKNVYSNSEIVYFTGYILKEDRTPITNHKIMAVALIRDVDSALIAEDKFLITNGLSFGSLTLPDSIPTGGYHFLVYTDKLINNLPEMLFTQNITIKSSIDPPFKASIRLVEPANDKNKLHKILISAASKDGRFLTKPAQITYMYNGLRQITTTDASGQAIITIPLSINLTDPNIYVKLKYGSDSTFMSMGLLQPKNIAVVKFYPEGGNMVNGLASNVSWEVKDQQNRPIAVKAFLLKNLSVIDTIETSSYGIGKFMLKPEIGADYTVKLIHSNVIDTTYRLPKAIDKGLALLLSNAFVKDTLRINLKSTEKLKLTLLVHNFKTCYLTIPFLMKSGNMILKLPLEDIPKGLSTLTILDSLSRPLAERIFFAHYAATEKINITTDRQIYKQREKVTLKLNLESGGKALVSIAAVQNNRLELKNMNDIESYAYLKNELSNLPIISNGRPYEDQNYLEQMLLVKSWRRYTWQDLMAAKSTDTLVKTDSLKVSGQINRGKKEITDSLVIGTMGSQNFNLIPTKKGFFSLQEEDMLTPAGQKMYVFVNGSQKLSYPTKITINDGFCILNQKLAKLIRTDELILPSSLINNAELLLKNNEKAIRLNEVVITNKSDNSFKRWGANPCGDYVCMYNILNCPNHVSAPGNTQPVKGNKYTSGGSTIVYAGCNIPDQNLFYIVKGIHLHKEFYTNDYKDPNEPAFFSTIYWNYGTLLNTKKETELTFFTSDITGKFRVVVQGVTDKDVVYAEHYFEVK